MLLKQKLASWSRKTIAVNAAFVALLTTQNALSQGAAQTVEQLGLSEVAMTLDDTAAPRCVGTTSTDRAQALLSCLNLDGDTEEVRQAWNQHPVYGLLVDRGEPGWIQDDRQNVSDFEDRLIAAIDASLSNGYNISPDSDWPEFDPDRTVIYGHTNWQHVRQLLALLETRDLHPRVERIDKLSSFVFRDSWGEPSRTLRQLSDGRRLASGIEFDLILEFASPNDISEFASLVTRYAKKDEADETGLLHGSWWQPFYRTLVPYDGALELTVLLVSYAGYRANLISLPEDALTKLAVLEDLHSDWDVEPTTIWVNPGFYRFILGDYR